MKKAFLMTLGALLVVLAAMVIVARHSARTVNAQRTDRALSVEEEASVKASAALMAQRRLNDSAALADGLLQKGKWRAATAQDPYLKAAEKSGDTPFAYTLSSGKNPDAIVLAPRFFTETTPTGRAALMIHEMAHYQAYVKTGSSDEFDGYKAEYDTHRQLGLSEADGLVYFGLLDGVAEYVAPRLPAYKNYPDIKAYLTQSNT